MYPTYIVQLYYGDDNTLNNNKLLEVAWVISDYGTFGIQVFRVEDMNLVYTLTWTSVFLMIDKILIKKSKFCPPCMLHWKAPANWENILLLKEEEIQPPPKYTCPHEHQQYLS